MKLPIPFEHNGEQVTDFTPAHLRAVDLADARKKSGSYAIMRKLIEGAIESLNGNDSREYISGALTHMPFQSLYTILVMSGAKTKGVDTVEATYYCPKCNKPRLYGKTDDDDMSDPLVYDVAKDLEIDYSFTPITITSKGEVIEEIFNITMRFPTISDYVKGEARHPDDDHRLMYYAYSQALLSVNGRVVDTKFRQAYGELIFQRMTIKEINGLSSKLEYGLGVVDRQCLDCKHKWKATLDISSFFDFAR